MQHVDVNFNQKTAAVTMAAGKSLSKDACEQALSGTSYKVASFKEVEAGK